MARGTLALQRQQLVELAAVGDAGQGIGHAQGFQALIEYLQLLGTLGDTSLQLALGALQALHQLVLRLQQLRLGLELLLTHHVDAIGQGECQQQHLQR